MGALALSHIRGQERLVLTPSTSQERWGAQECRLAGEPVMQLFGTQLTRPFRSSSSGTQLAPPLLITRLS